MITSDSRGHKTYYNTKDKQWHYIDNNEIDNDTRPCKRCGCAPTKEGYDACLGHIEGVLHACCGHGVSLKYVVYDNE